VTCCAVDLNPSWLSGEGELSATRAAKCARQQVCTTCASNVMRKGRGFVSSRSLSAQQTPRDPAFQYEQSREGELLVGQMADLPET